LLSRYFQPLEALVARNPTGADIPAITIEQLGDPPVAIVATLRRQLREGVKQARDPRADRPAFLLRLLADTQHHLSYRVVEQSYSSQFGERPVLRLSDGTKIQLNSNSKIRTKITSTNREVTLDKGEAYFEIAHDPNRPFAVFAGNRRITDIGTSFSVSREGENVRVIVTEGRVRVDLINSSPIEEPVFADKQNLIVAKADETLIAPKNSEEISNDLSWRNGMLVFNQQTLADAADEFRRGDLVLVRFTAGRKEKTRRSWSADAGSELIQGHNERNYETLEARFSFAAYLCFHGTRPSQDDCAAVAASNCHGVSN